MCAFLKRNEDNVTTIFSNPHVQRLRYFSFPIIWLHPKVPIAQVHRHAGSIERYTVFDKYLYCIFFAGERHVEGRVGGLHDALITLQFHQTD